MGPCRSTYCPSRLHDICCRYAYRRAARRVQRRYSVEPRESRVLLTTLA
jgi:hypothetical protein